MIVDEEKGSIYATPMDSCGISSLRFSIGRETSSGLRGTPGFHASDREANAGVLALTDQHDSYSDFNPPMLRKYSQQETFFQSIKSITAVW